MRAWHLAIATVAAFIVFSLTWLEPLLAGFGTTYLLPDASYALSRADAMLTSWMLAWGAHALRTDPLHLFHANIFHPLPWTFAFSENLLAGALLVLPVDLAAGNPVLDHNVLVVATFVLSGVGTALLLHELGAALPAAWLAGAIVAFDPFRFASLGHVHGLSGHWMPFALLALHRCLRRGRGAVLVAVTLLLVSLSSVYYAYFFGLAAGVFLLLHWMLRCPAAPGGRRRALAGCIVAGIATAAMLVPYAIVSEIYALGRPSIQAEIFAGKASHYLGALADPVGYLTRRYGHNQQVRVFIGLGTITLLAVGLAAGATAQRGGRRLTSCYGLLALAMAMVSLGPSMQWNFFGPAVPGPWTLLATVVPGWTALRVPVRACVVAVLAVAVVAGLGADAIWRRVRGTAARVLIIACFAAIGVAESWRPPPAVFAVPWAAGVPPVYRWLAAQPGRDPIVELPFGVTDRDASYMVMSATHWRSLLNGYTGFAPATPYVRGVLFWFPSPQSLRMLHSLGVRWVVVHAGELKPAQADLCRRDPAGLKPYLLLAYRDGDTCVFDVRSAPAEEPHAPDRPISLAGTTVTSSTGEDAGAAIDGQVDTHWVQTVDRNDETWLQLDLPVPHVLSRIVVHLGSHFGEFLRQWRIDTTSDGVTWQPSAIEPSGLPPLDGMRIDPARLTTELRLPNPTSTQSIRIVRTKATAKTPFDVWPSWSRWGVHELEVFEPTSSVPTSAAASP